MQKTILMTDILALGFAMIYVLHVKKASPQKKVDHDPSIEARFWGAKEGHSYQPKAF